MSDWQPGDLALCVARIPSQPLVDNGHGNPWRPAKGSVHEVIGVWTEADFDSWPTGSVALQFAPSPMNCFGHRFFVKITPSEADEFDQETIKLLNSVPARERECV